jgi:hypothetical protein
MSPRSDLLARLAKLPLDEGLKPELAVVIREEIHREFEAVSTEHDRVALLALHKTVMDGFERALGSGLN